MNKKTLALMFALGLIGTACQKEPSSLPPEDRHAPFEYTARRGMVVAAHPLAARAGVDILKQGGNAVDAAVATAFALNASEPFASGIGGGGFMVVYLAGENTITVIDFRETAPGTASPEMFHQDGIVQQEKRRNHGLAVAVPGALAGWTHALNKYGSKTLNEVTQGAIQIAEQGFEISPTFSKINKDEYEKIFNNAGEDTCYLNEGFPYEPGDTFRNSELADFLRRLAEIGPADFYTGETASRIVAAVQDKGGILTKADLASYEPQEYAPLTGSFGDYTLYTTMPPSCGGLHILQLLNIVSLWPLEEWGHNSPAYIHHLSEAFRFVFADKARYLGDPRFVTIPTGQLISQEYARSIAARIQETGTAGHYPSGNFGQDGLSDENTTHLCVIDKNGNMVSLTQSINHFFGSGIVVGGTGFLLNNHMDDFSTNPESPNAPAPHRRPVSNMGPLFLFKSGRPFLALGSPGGTRIFPSLTQILLNITMFRMSLDQAIEAPRFFSYSDRGQARDIYLENRIPEITRQALINLGHTLSIRGDYDTYFGGAQAILVLPDKGLIQGGADSRRDGAGAGY